MTPITNLVNLSLKSGVFPDMLKMSHITPLLKKPSLSKDDMKNYRPASNLNFISKLLEKIIATRIRFHLESNDLLNRYQSAYRPMHSTALLKVQNDLLRNLDDGKTTVLVLLDLSAAFDTLDHSEVISLLENWYGISENALRWFASYLMDRQQMVKGKECVGEPFQTKYGVPQGSVLGPPLFTLYTTPLSKIITWMRSSKLKLNPDKTEFFTLWHKITSKRIDETFPRKFIRSRNSTNRLCSKSWSRV